MTIELPNAEWQACVKLPVTVHVRTQREGETHVSTREGITPIKLDDLIMRGVQGEEYPIGREIFERTYRMGEAFPPKPDTEELEALQKDAARYRYLRSESRREALDKWGPAAGCWIDSEDEHHNLILLTGEDADEAIDNAMEENHVE